MYLRKVLKRDFYRNHDRHTEPNKTLNRSNFQLQKYFLYDHHHWLCIFASDEQESSLFVYISEMKLDNCYHFEYLDNWLHLFCYTPNILTDISGRTHNTVDKAFDWKVLLSEIIWRLQVQSQQQVRMTRNTYYNLTLTPSHE